VPCACRRAGGMHSAHLPLRPASVPIRLCGKPPRVGDKDEQVCLPMPLSAWSTPRSSEGSNRKSSRCAVAFSCILERLSLRTLNIARGSMSSFICLASTLDRSWMSLMSKRSCRSFLRPALRIPSTQAANHRECRPPPGARRASSADSGGSTSCS